MEISDTEETQSKAANLGFTDRLAALRTSLQLTDVRSINRAAARLHEDGHFYLRTPTRPGSANRPSNDGEQDLHWPEFNNAPTHWPEFRDRPPEWSSWGNWNDWSNYAYVPGRKKEPEPCLG